MNRINLHGVWISVLAVLFAIAQDCSANLTITNGGVSNITRLSSIPYGQVTGTNGTTNAISLLLYWGQTDCTTNGGSWTYSNVQAVATSPIPVTVTNLCTNLAASTHYYCRWYATQGSNSAWASLGTNYYTLTGVPTGAAPVIAWTPVMVDSNGLLASPTNFFTTNGIARTNDITDLQAAITGLSGTQALDHAGVVGLQSTQATVVASVSGLSSTQSTAVASITGLSSTQSTAVAAITGLSGTQALDHAGVVGLQSTQATAVAAITGLSGTQALDHAAVTGLQSTQSTAVAAITGLSSTQAVNLVTDWSTKPMTNSVKLSGSNTLSIGDPTNPLSAVFLHESSLHLGSNTVSMSNGTLWVGTPGSTSFVEYATETDLTARVALKADKNRPFVTTTYDPTLTGSRYLDPFTLHDDGTKIGVDPRIENNLNLLTFDQLVRHGISDYGMADGYVDAFRNTNHINHGASVNQRWNSSTNFYFNWTDSGASANSYAIGWRYYDMGADSDQDIGIILDDTGVWSTLNPASNFTIMGWICLTNRTAEVEHCIFSFNNLSDVFGKGFIFEYYENASYGFLVNENPTDDGIVTQNGNLQVASDTNWHHLAAVYSNNNSWTFYWDATTSNTEASSGTWAMPDAGVRPRIGSHAQSRRGANGMDLDEFVIFKRALSAAEIVQAQALGRFTNSSAPFDNGVIASFHFDENIGTNVTDSSGLGNHGAWAQKMVLGTDGGGHPWADWIAGVYPAGADPSVTNCMTLQSTNFLLTFVPSSIKLDVWAQNQSSVGAPNTDLVGWVSRDNGTTWTNVPFSLSNAFTTSLTNQMYSGIAVVTNQPSGSNVIVKVTTSNGIPWKVYGLGWTAGGSQ